MEKSTRDRADSQLSLPHPSTPSSSSSSNYNHNLSNNNNSISDGVTILNSIPKSQPPITRSDPNNPYPTTFVQADTSSFKQVVQMLTGSSETTKLASQSQSQSKPTTHRSPDPNSHHAKNPIPPTRPVSKPKPSRLYERRNSFTGLRGINPLIPAHPNFSTSSSSSPRKFPEVLSPSLLDFPGLALSPVTPLISDPFNRSPGSVWMQPNLNSNAVDKLAEEKAIAEKGFYLHRSPSTTPRDSSAEPPRLLPLFPVTSPKIAGSD